jgi:hypothetical protein
LTISLIGWRGPCTEPDVAPPTQTNTPVSKAPAAMAFRMGAVYIALDAMKTSLLCRALGFKRAAAALRPRPRYGFATRKPYDLCSSVLENRGLKPYDATVRWQDLGLRGPQPVRDLWQQKDVVTFTDTYTVTVPPHGAIIPRPPTPRRWAYTGGLRPHAT